MELQDVLVKLSNTLETLCQKVDVLVDSKNGTPQSNADTASGVSSRSTISSSASQYIDDSSPFRKPSPQPRVPSFLNIRSDLTSVEGRTPDSAQYNKAVRFFVSANGFLTDQTFQRQPESATKGYLDSIEVC